MRDEVAGYARFGLVPDTAYMLHMAPHNTFICEKSMMKNAPLILFDLLTRFDFGVLLVELDYADPLSMRRRVCKLDLPIKHLLPGEHGGVVDIVNCKRWQRCKNKGEKRVGEECEEEELSRGNHEPVTFNKTLEVFKKTAVSSACSSEEKREIVVTLDAKGLSQKKECHLAENSLLTMFEEWNKTYSGPQNVEFFLRVTSKSGNSGAKNIMPITTLVAERCKKSGVTASTPIKTYHPGKRKDHDHYALPELLRTCSPSFPAFDLYSKQPHHHMIRAVFCYKHPKYGSVRFKSIKLPDRSSSKRVVVRLTVPENYTKIVLRYFTTEGVEQKELEQKESTVAAENHDLWVNGDVPVLCAHLVDKDGKMSQPHAVKLRWETPLDVLSSRLDGEPDNNVHFGPDPGFKNVAGPHYALCVGRKET